MLRQSLYQSSRQLRISSRAFSTSLRAMADGDTGATRAGGAAQGDAWTKREKGNEDAYVRKQEYEKLQALKAKIKDQQGHLDQLTEHIDDLMKDSGGQGEQK